MGKRLNPFTGTFDYVDFLGSFASAPTGSTGATYYNTSDNGLYVYNGTSWVLLMNLSYPGGYIYTASSAPASPFEGMLFINTTNHTMYVYYESMWQVMHVLDTAVAEYLLLEDGGYLLQENGDKLVLD